MVHRNMFHILAVRSGMSSIICCSATNKFLPVENQNCRSSGNRCVFQALATVIQVWAWLVLIDCYVFPGCASTKLGRILESAQ
jgi:hypothetical protein